jgi:hypothetical protein
VETLRNRASNPETRPEYREGAPPDDQRLARLHAALGATAVRGASVSHGRDDAALRAGQLAVRDQTADGRSGRDEGGRSNRG